MGGSGDGSADDSILLLWAVAGLSAYTLGLGSID